jgi:hypothetical protein
MLDLRPNPKEKHGVWDPMPEPIVILPYVHSRVDSQHILQPYAMSESILPFASVDFIPLSGTLDEASGFSLCLRIRIQM